MGLFQEWLIKRELSEGMPAGFAPSPVMGHSPLVSAMEKIQRNQGKMPFQTWTGADALMTQFGMMPQEIQALQQAKLFGPAPQGGGYVLNQQRFGQIYQQMVGTAPKMNQQQPPKGPNGLPYPPPPPA